MTAVVESPTLTHMGEAQPAVRNTSAVLAVECQGPAVRGTVCTFTPTHAEWRVFGYISAGQLHTSVSVTVYGTNEHGTFAPGSATYPEDEAPQWLARPEAWLEQATVLVGSAAPAHRGW